MRLNCWYNPQLNQWHQIDPLAENYYALSSYNYVANNPIKYIDPDGRDFGVDEFNPPPPPGGENPPEVPGCPECNPGSMLQEVLVTAPWFIGPQRQEEILAHLDGMKEVSQQEQAAMPPYVDNILHGDAIVQDNSLIQLFYGPEDVAFIGAAKLLAVAPFVVKGVKWGTPAGKLTYGAAKSNVLLSTSRQLQAKFKHAADFGILGNYSKGNASKFSSAINRHINSAGVQAIQGTYRGQPVIHYLNPNTGLDVISSPLGHFISGWQLNPAQLQNVLKHGGL